MSHIDFYFFTATYHHFIYVAVNFFISVNFYISSSPEVYQRPLRALMKEQKNGCFPDLEVYGFVAGAVCQKHQDLSVIQVLGV